MDNELKALSFKDEINANHRECLRAGNEAIQHAFDAGRLLAKAKGFVGHGNFGGWIEQFCDFSHQTANGYMSLHKDLESLSNSQRVRILESAQSVRSLRNLIAESKPKPPKPRDSSGQSQGGSVTEPAEPRPVESPPDTEESAYGQDPGLPNSAAYSTEPDYSSQSADVIDEDWEPRQPSYFERFQTLWEEADETGRAAIRAFVLDEDKPKRKRFVPPTVDEVREYCEQRDNNVDAESFVDHYQARGWIPKGYTRQMKDWKAAVRTWERHGFRPEGKRDTRTIKDLT